MNYSYDRLTQARKVIEKSLDGMQDELMKAFGSVEHRLKDDDSVVTDLDRKVEDRLKRDLAEFDAGIGFCGEETGVDYEQKVYWIVDPIDGTEQFIRGIPSCATMIALIVDGRVEMGLINFFAAKTQYFAIRGSGAFRNEKRIKISNRTLKQSMMEFESKLESSEEKAKYFSVRDRIYGYVNLCVSAPGYCHVAAGETEARIAINGWGSPWDCAAGSILVEEAGGKVANIGPKKTANYDFLNTDMVAANPYVFDKLMELLST